ncbi:regulator of gluconeogenesis Rmd5 [Sarocladium strictum]
MPEPDDLPASPFATLRADVARMRRSGLRHAINDVDKVIDILTAAREQVAQDGDLNRIAMNMMALQNPIKARCDAITDDLKTVTKAQRAFGKALDKAMPDRNIPMETDAMAEHTRLINRAIAMHLLREGQFSVASTFLREIGEPQGTSTFDTHPEPPASHLDSDGDDDMETADEAIESNWSTQVQREDHILQSDELQASFSEMYSILSDLKSRRLIPAIDWARRHGKELEAKGSNLEFQLCKLQYIWLFKGPAVNGLPDDHLNGPSGARIYARDDLVHFQSRYPREVQQLCCAMVYAPNIAGSPYRQLFEIDSAFDDVAISFTREFCSLLGLSAESPLYVAATAGAIALPRLIKYTTYMKEKKTEWTTENELAFETPLPGSMIYHPIFVCPVSKEQTTEGNPPMLIPCGHVISKESLQNIAKGSRFKCPYCPQEGLVKDARKIAF